MSTVYVGIDPGMTGAIAAVRESSKPFLADMPVRYVAPKRSGGKGKNVLDLPALRSILAKLRKESQAHETAPADIYVMIEVAGMRSTIFPSQPPHRCNCGKNCMTVGQGAASMGTFQRQYGEVIGLLAGLYITYEEVDASTWKRDVFRGVGGSDKDASRAKAAALYPSIADRLKLKKSHGLAEALLLANYGERRRTAPF